MSLEKHFNLLYSGTTPLNLGDRYYSQDLIRDLLYSWDNAGQIARRIGGDFPMLLMGGVVTAGTGAHCLDITEAWGICNYSVEHPDTFAALPPSKTSSDIVRIVHAASQNELDTSALDTPATADGATPNYVKLRYIETNGNTRTRARAAGTYAYEVVPSYEYYCDAVAPTDYDVLLATVTITAMGVVTVTSSEVSYNMKDIQDDLDTAEAAIDVLEEKHGTTNSAVITDDYAPTDTDNTNDLFIDPGDHAIIITLPTLADNLGRIFRIKVIDSGGAVTVDGEGAETIEGLTTFVMQSSGDHLNIIGQATSWRILSCHSKLDTGWINTADWTNRHLGSSVCTYDTKTGSFSIGEILTEYSDAGYTTPTGVTGIIMADSGTALIMKNVTGTGVWTNNYYLKGSTSAAVALVNVSTKNVDSVVTHNFGISLPYLKVTRLYYAGTSGSDATGKYLDTAFAAGGVAGNTAVFGISTSEIQIQTGGGGLYTTDDAGNQLLVTTSDYSYKIIVEYKK